MNITISNVFHDLSGHPGFDRVHADVINDTGSEALSVWTTDIEISEFPTTVEGILAILSARVIDDWNADTNRTPISNADTFYLFTDSGLLISTPVT